MQDIIKGFGGESASISYAAFSDALVRKISFAAGAGVDTDGIVRQISKQLLDAAEGGAPQRNFVIPNFDANDDL